MPGIFVEAGCALGGSTIVIAHAKEQERPLRVYDVFDMIPPPTAEDPARGSRTVQANLHEFGFSLERDNISLNKGWCRTRSSWTDR